MKRLTAHAVVSVREVVLELEAENDPRKAMMRLNERIGAYRQAGEDVPAELLRLSQALAMECAIQSQGR